LQILRNNQPLKKMASRLNKYIVAKRIIKKDEKAEFENSLSV